MLHCGEMGHISRNCPYGGYATANYTQENTKYGYPGYEWNLVEANLMEYKNATWYMDSGASYHVIGNYEHLYDVGASSSGHNVTTADGNAHHVEAIGSSNINTGNFDGINIDHVLYVPALSSREERALRIHRESGCSW